MWDAGKGSNMLLLTNCEIHTGKYSDRSLDVRTERKPKVGIFSRMDRTNWSIRALLYSRNQTLMIYAGQNDPKLVLTKLQFNNSLNIKFPLNSI